MEKSNFSYDSIMDKEKGCKIFYNRNKVIQYEMFDIREIIPNSGDRLRFYDLSHNINKKDNSLFFVDIHKAKRYADESSVAEILGCSVDAARKFIKRMCDIGVYKRVKERVGNSKVTKIYVNPLYYQATSYISVELYYLFEDYLFDVTPNDMKKFYREVRENRENGLIETFEESQDSEFVVI